MKLWLLRPVPCLPAADNPWIQDFDRSFGFVVRAETEAEAREFAHADAGPENYSGKFIDSEFPSTNGPWKDARYSTCVELLPEGEPGVVMGDFATG